MLRSGPPLFHLPARRAKQLDSHMAHGFLTSSPAFVFTPLTRAVALPFPTIQNRSFMLFDELELEALFTAWLNKRTVAREGPMAPLRLEEVTTVGMKWGRNYGHK